MPWGRSNCVRSNPNPNMEPYASLCSKHSVVFEHKKILEKSTNILYFNINKYCIAVTFFTLFIGFWQGS